MIFLTRRLQQEMVKPNSSRTVADIIKVWNSCPKLFRYTANSIQKLLHQIVLPFCQGRRLEPPKDADCLSKAIFEPYWSSLVVFSFQKTINAYTCIYEHREEQVMLCAELEKSYHDFFEIVLQSMQIFCGNEDGKAAEVRAALSSTIISFMKCREQSKAYNEILESESQFLRVTSTITGDSHLY